MYVRWIVGSLVVAMGLAACSDKVENAMEAAKALSKLGEQAKQLSEAASKAEAEAEKKAKAQIAPGTDPALAKQQIDMAKSMAALSAMGQASGPVVNWRDLAPFVPEKLGALELQGKLDGSTNSMGSAQVSKVERNYKAGEQSVEVSITDASGVAMLKMPFTMAAMLNEDSTRGYKKGKRVADQPAIAEWVEDRKQSSVTMLVGDRYIVSVRVRRATAHDDAEKLAAQLDIAGLAKLKPAAQ